MKMSRTLKYVSIFAVLLLMLIRTGSADHTCAAIGGKCQLNTIRCPGGYVSGKCTGPWNRQCCKPDPDLACKNLGGTCKYTYQGCSGNFQRGKCGGPVNRQCCISGSTGSITKNCRQCICQVEGCSRLVGRCNWDVNSYSCGPYQIKEPYWIDCGRPGGNWRTCTTQFACSETCMDGYFRRYGTLCTGGRTPTCQDYARIHNGGPSGCRRSSTLGYWSRVRACCNGKPGGCD